MIQIHATSITTIEQTSLPVRTSHVEWSHSPDSSVSSSTCRLPLQNAQYHIPILIQRKERDSIAHVCVYMPIAHFTWVHKYVRIARSDRVQVCGPH